MEPERRIEILLVEDNPDHAEFTQRALSKSGLGSTIVWVKDGMEALDYLHRRNAFQTHALKPLPGLVLLDISLPKRNGFEVLTDMRSDPVLRVVPVIMLTTSGREEEIRKSFELGANSFVTKPVEVSEFLEKIRHLDLYRLVVKGLPVPVIHQPMRAESD
jgi:DNA-binding response OmpR family regulator